MNHFPTSSWALSLLASLSLGAAMVPTGCVKKTAPATAGSPAEAQTTESRGASGGGKASTATAPGKNHPGATADCTIWSSHWDGPYKYENNQWGHDKSAGEFEQCLLERQVAGRTQLGWTWHWPGHDPSVFAYPQIIFGWKPWSGGNPTDPRFPMRVADVQHIVMRYAVETEASGSYNLAPEIWLTESGEWSTAPNPKLISAEIMFWMDYQGEARPAGDIVDRPRLGELAYELWKMDEIGDKGDGTGWTIYTFKSPRIQRRGSIEIHTLLGYLVEQGHVSADHYVASIEFGNEIMGGSGTTWVEQFELEVKP